MDCKREWFSTFCRYKNADISLMHVIVTHKVQPTARKLDHSSFLVESGMPLLVLAWTPKRDSCTFMWKVHSSIFLRNGLTTDGTECYAIFKQKKYNIPNLSLEPQKCIVSIDKQEKYIFLSVSSPKVHENLQII